MKAVSAAFYSIRIHPRRLAAGMNAERGKGVGKTLVFPWRRAANPPFLQKGRVSVENRGFSK